MKAQITIQQINEDFNQEYADEYHGGKESENNFKTIWGNKFPMMEKVKQYKLDDFEEYIWTIKDKSGDKFELQLKNMKVFEVETDTGQVIFGASQKILDNAFLIDKNGVCRCYFNLKGDIAEDEHYEILFDSFYIAKDEIPDKLLKVAL